MDKRNLRASNPPQEHPGGDPAHDSGNPAEETLRAAEALLRLERREAPAGFAERVLARAAAEHAQGEELRRGARARWWPYGAPGWGWAVAAVLLVMLAAPALWTAHTDAQGRQAAAQFELAMRLTQRQLAEAGEHAAAWHALPGAPQAARPSAGGPGHTTHSPQPLE